MFTKLIFLTLILSNYLTFADKIIVTPAMIVSGKIIINSPTVTKITFAEGDYTALTHLYAFSIPSLTSLAIPNTLTALTHLWASGNTSLTSLVIPNTLTELKMLEVSGNTSLESLAIPNTLNKLKRLEVSCNTSLKSLAIPNTLTALKELSASDNTSLTSLVIPGTLTALRRLDTSSNTSLTSLVIPDTLTALKELSASDNTYLTSLVMDNAMVNRSHQLAFVAPRTPETLAFAARSLHSYRSIRFETEDVTIAAHHGAVGGAGAAPIAVMGQEALTALRAEILGKWTAFKTANAPLVAELLPILENAPKDFDEILPKFYEKLEHLIHVKSKKDEKGKFRFQVAMQGLQLLHGDLSIPTYNGQASASYRTTHAEGMPNNLQIFVLLYRIAERNIITHKEVFVRNWLAGTFTTNFAGFKASYPKYADYASLGEVLNEHNPEGEKLVKVLVELLDGENHKDAEKVLGSHIPKDAIKMAKRYQITQHEDTLNPIIEALFMTLRGHNNILFDSGEIHKPACAFGSYLQMLRALSDPSFALPGAEAFGGVEIINCAP